METRQMSLVKANANEPLKRRHNGPSCHQNRVFVYGPGRVRRLPDYRSGGGWRECQIGLSMELGNLSF